MDKVLYRFRWDCGRMGSVTGMFTATESQLQAEFGEDVYFGEILGKHSEVCGALNRGDITVLTQDQDFIAKAEEYGLVPTGYNPLEYLTKNRE